MMARMYAGRLRQTTMWAVAVHIRFPNCLCRWIHRGRGLRGSKKLRIGEGGVDGGELQKHGSRITQSEKTRGGDQIFRITITKWHDIGLTSGLAIADMSNKRLSCNEHVVVCLFELDELFTAGYERSGADSSFGQGVLCELIGRGKPSMMTRRR